MAGRGQPALYLVIRFIFGESSMTLAFVYPMLGKRHMRSVWRRLGNRPCLFGTESGRFDHHHRRRLGAWLKRLFPLLFSLTGQGLPNYGDQRHHGMTMDGAYTVRWFPYPFFLAAGTRIQWWTTGGSVAEGEQYPCCFGSESRRQ